MTKEPDYEVYREMMASFIGSAAEKLKAKVRMILLRNQEEILVFLRAEFDRHKLLDGDVGHQWPEGVELVMEGDRSKHEDCKFDQLAIPRITVTITTPNGFKVIGRIDLGTTIHDA